MVNGDRIEVVHKCSVPRYFAIILFLTLFCAQSSCFIIFVFFLNSIRYDDFINNVNAYCKCFGYRQQRSCFHASFHKHWDLISNTNVETKTKAYLQIHLPRLILKYITKKLCSRGVPFAELVIIILCFLS